MFSYYKYVRSSRYEAERAKIECVLLLHRMCFSYYIECVLLLHRMCFSYYRYVLSSRYEAERAKVQRLAAELQLLRYAQVSKQTCLYGKRDRYMAQEAYEHW